MAKLLIFTDLDGTLLDSETYQYAAALPVLEQLQVQAIPVIPVTSKTRAEVATLRQAIGLSDPFITENGSGIFIPVDANPFPQPPGEREGDYYVVELGCPYVQARAGLRVIANEIHHPLKGFGDFTVDKLQDYTGLSAEAAHQAKAREFSEPFITPKAVPTETLQQGVEAMGFQVVVGDRFSHLIGPQAGKGTAVRQLVQLYTALYQEKPVTVGLGNSPNDLPMLEAVDQAIVLPGAKGPHPLLAERGWTIAPAPAPEGWAQAIQTVLQTA